MGLFGQDCQRLCKHAGHEAKAYCHVACWGCRVIALGPVPRLAPCASRCAPRDAQVPGPFATPTLAAPLGTGRGEGQPGEREGGGENQLPPSWEEAQGPLSTLKHTLDVGCREAAVKLDLSSSAALKRGTVVNHHLGSSPGQLLQEHPQQGAREWGEGGHGLHVSIPTLSSSGYSGKYPRAWGTSDAAAPCLLPIGCPLWHPERGQRLSQDTGRRKTRQTERS